jgi:hypothetical protein
MSMLLDAIGQVGNWLDRRDRRGERDDAAVKAVLLAVNETKLYIASLDRGEPQRRNQERLLVQLWTDAAVAIRRSDPHLAERLQMKAEYWADPENWSDNDVQSAEIGIESVAARARALLSEGP